MISMFFWVVVLAGSTAAICFTVALDAQNVHLSATALVSFGIVAAAVNEHRGNDAAGATAGRLTATASRYIGLLWAWSAISSYIAYALLLDWPYWSAVVAAIFIGCGMCLYVALVLGRQTFSATPDSGSTRLANLMTKGQFVFGALLLGAATAIRNAPYIEIRGANR